MRQASVERKTSIVDAALKEASKVGYNCIERNAVAARAGVSNGLVTHYFTNMQLLKDAVITKAIEEGNVAVVAEAAVYKHKGARRAINRQPLLRQSVAAFIGL